MFEFILFSGEQLSWYFLVGWLLETTMLCPLFSSEFLWTLTLAENALFQLPHTNNDISSENKIGTNLMKISEDPVFVSWSNKGEIDLHQES